MTSPCLIYLEKICKQVKAMKGVGGSGERLHSSSSSSGPNQWEMVAMDYVDLNDLVPQVFCHFIQIGIFLDFPFVSD